MHATPRSGLVAGIAVMATIALAASPASASTVIGQSPPLNNSGPAGCGNHDAAFLQLGVSGGPSYVVPAGGGVITSWKSSVVGDIQPMALRIYTGNPSGSQFTPVAESAVETFPDGQPTSFPARMAVSGGEMLGLRVEGVHFASGCIYLAPSSTDLVGLADTVMPVGQTETDSTKVSMGRLNVSAVLEPDADHDGFGDETQDQCPTDASTQGPCPLTPVSKKKKHCKHKKKHTRGVVTAKKCQKKHH